LKLTKPRPVFSIVKHNVLLVAGRNCGYGMGDFCRQGLRRMCAPPLFFSFQIIKWRDLVLYRLLNKRRVIRCSCESDLFSG